MQWLTRVARVKAVNAGAIASMLTAAFGSAARAERPLQAAVNATAVQQSAVDSATPAGIVQLLVSRHIAGTMGFDTTSVAAKRRWLSSALQVRLARYFARPVKAGEMPAIDFDPFIDAQDYPAKFTVGAARTAGGRASVPVRFADGVTHYTVMYVLRNEGGAWRIADIRDRRGGSLMALLR